MMLGGSGVNKKRKIAFIPLQLNLFQLRPKLTTNPPIHNFWTNRKLLTLRVYGFLLLLGVVTLIVRILKINLFM